MSLSIVSCGIFRYELEKVLPEIEAELGCAVSVDFLTPALDVNASLLEKSVTEKLDLNQKQKTALLYGSMCHTEWPRITEKSGAPYPRASNCAEMLLSPEKKKELDAGGNVYFLTMGGLKQWKEIYRQGHGWDAADARVNFGYFDKIIVLDSGVFEIKDEDLFEFFEFTQIPVETMSISLDYFTSVVTGLCRKLLNSEML
ncbi:MAG: DUF1638 domain-containing protein [Spirochaetaceae bacterium]|jgi:hypothetical protein|nr:DUF1638 domain-containing protein [Spirochaetaceae bacterium]